MMDLSGKVALVTGGTLGIGAAIVVELARRGADVSVVARNQGEQADALRKRIETLGRRLLLLGGDMSKPEDCAAAVEMSVAHFGRLDVLIHNAGGPSPGKIEDVSPEQWCYTMDLHVNANYYLARAALPHLKKPGEGCIITISSTAGVLGVPGAIAYATAKGALPQFTRSLARDLADHNIRVNCVAPGVIRTRFHADMTAERKELNLKHRIPLHREGTPEQVAEVVALLVTNDYITGETIVIDGGLTSRIA
jgi:NAD(P)-dependent dehydrogenase (short-subunit alcohol dehydrogenase family)